LLVEAVLAVTVWESVAVWEYIAPQRYNSCHIVCAGVVEETRAPPKLAKPRARRADTGHVAGTRIAPSASVIKGLTIDGDSSTGVISILDQSLKTLPAGRRVVDASRFST